MGKDRFGLPQEAMTGSPRPRELCIDV